MGGIPRKKGMDGKQGVLCDSVVKNPPYSAEDGDLGLIPGWGRPPWSWKRQLTPVFLPGKSHGHRSLACSIGSQGIRHDLVTKHARTNCKKQITTQGTPTLAPEENLF